MASMPDFVVATMTLARDDAESALILKSLAALARSGLPVIGTDGGSSSTFLDRARSIAGVTMLSNDDAPGLVGQIRKSLARAREWASILYTEPDKHAFFTEHVDTFLDAAARQHESSVILASRSIAGFASYPASQRMAEGLLNHVCGSLTGLHADYSYGPFVLRADVLGLVEDVPTTLGWGWRPYLFVRAHRNGHRLASIEGDFFCPDDQRHDSAAERHHRIRQLAQNLQGVSLALEAGGKGVGEVQRCS